MNEEMKLIGTAEPADYMDEEGLLVCGRCGERKQMHFETKYTAPCIVPVLCRCGREAREREQQLIRQEKLFWRAERNRRACFGEDRKRWDFTFAKDDKRDAEASAQAQGYVRRFEEMRSRGKGLLFLGGCGVGKTYLACCIANALLDQGHTVRVTSFMTIANRLQSTFDKLSVHKELLDCDLLVLDDLAAERDTAFMQEIVFQVVDERTSAGKPMIVTSNLSTQKLTEADNLARQRILSRIQEACVPIVVKGIDRRQQTMKHDYRADKAKLMEMRDFNA